MWVALTDCQYLKDDDLRRAVGRSERDALQKLRTAIEGVDLCRFPIMEDFVQAYSVRVLHVPKQRRLPTPWIV